MTDILIEPKLRLPVFNTDPIGIELPALGCVPERRTRIARQGNRSSTNNATHDFARQRLFKTAPAS